MSGGSIYIDPDNVSSVSSQIGITAEQLDSLRRSIVPQVNEVISMSYPSIQEMPGVAYPLNTTQGNIEAFNYRAQLLVEDLRTTSQKLGQIAEAGRTMNEILLRQTTMFGSTGAGGIIGMPLGDGVNSISLPNIPDWLKQLLSTGGASIGLANTLIAILSHTKTLTGNEAFQEFAGSLDEVSTKLDKVNFLLELLASRDDPKGLVTELISNGISKGVDNLIGDNPYGLAVMAAFSVVSFAGAGLGSLQGSLANHYANNSQIQQALESTAKGLTEASKHADPQKVYDDVGKTVFDTGAAILGFGSWASAGKDMRGALNDTASTVYSIPQFVADTGFMVQQDSNLAINALVQNSSLPQSWKSVYQANTINDIKITGQFANFVNGSVPTQAGKLTDAAQNIIATGSQQFYNQEVVVQ